MSFKIKNKKKTTILSFPEFDNAIIVDILDDLPDNPPADQSPNIPSEPVDSVKNESSPFFIGSEPLPAGQVYNQTNTNDNLDPDQGEPQAFQTRETYFAYKIYFIADLRKAINTNNLRVRASVRRSLPQGFYKFFDNNGDGPPPDVKSMLAMIRGRDRDKKSEMARAQPEGLIEKQNVDLIKFINTQKLKNAKSLSDADLFGTKEINVLVSSAEIGKSGGNMLVSQQAVGTGDFNMKHDGTDFPSLAVEDLLRQGMDPASAFYPSHTFSSSDPRRDGCFFENERPEKSESATFMQNSLRFNTLFSKSGKDPAFPGMLGTSRYKAGFPLAVRRKVPDRMKLVELKFLIPESRLKNSGIFWLKLDLLDESDIIVQTKIQKIDHVKNVEDYYAPKSLISFKASSNKNSQSKYINLFSRRRDTNTRGCEVYMREIGERSTPENSPFGRKPVTKLEFRDNQVRAKLRIPVLETVGKTYSLRALPVSKTGKVYSNFDSSVITSGMYTQYRSSLYTTCTKDSIQIVIKSASPDVIGLEIQRRDLTKNETKFKSIKAMAEYQEGINDPTRSKMTSPARTLGTQTLKTHFSYDYDVERGHVYEYREKLHLKYGVTKMSSFSRYQTFIPSNQRIKVMIQRSKTFSGTAKSAIKENFQRDGMSVILSVDYNVKDTDSHKLLQLLSQLGLDGIFPGEIESIKSSLNTLIFCKVSRFNSLTGETAYLGVFQPGSPIIDDGRRTAAVAPTRGQVYIYRAEACLVLPSDAASLINSQIAATGQKIDGTSDIEDPSIIYQLKGQGAKRAALGDTAESSDALNTAFRLAEAQKYYTQKSLRSGTINMIQNTHESVLSQYPIGDFAEVTIRTNVSVEFSNMSVSYGNEKSGPILSWTIRNGQTTDLDFFIVVAEKLGIKTISGTAHCPSSGIINYADITNAGFVGNIDYTAIPVFSSGLFGQEIFVGSITLYPAEKKFKRST